MKAFVSWSGGKDSMLALWRARQAGIEVAVLLNMIDEEGVRSRSHGLPAEVLRAQAWAMDLKIVQPRASWDSYETAFKDALRSLAGEDIKLGVFGAIDGESNRQWVARVCAECGIVPRLPLWKAPRGGLLQEFVDRGFKAVTCVVNTRKLNPSWLGRTLDLDFLREIRTLPGVDPSGEGGEYHTLVLDGPAFCKRLAIVRSAPRIEGPYAILDIMEHRLERRGGTLRKEVTRIL